ncbi:hypothetical protein SAMN03159423_5076 [Bradyrhizobium sp. NFR13]|nr:hypothetical protein SAMN03159423_5076 [Bradyrhizobium sp. NFR13]
MPVSVVIPFPMRVAAPQADECEIDLLSAVDLAIRDLREISQTANDIAQARARECLAMLESAYAGALQG